MQLLKNKYIQNNSFDFLCNIVLEAGTILKNNYEKTLINKKKNLTIKKNVKEKSFKELLIDEDLISEKILIEGIKNFDEDAMIYSEEKDNPKDFFSKKNNQKKRFIIDPLDGTHN